MSVILFDDYTFPNLISRDFNPGYNMLGLDDVEDSDLMLFLGEVTNEFIQPDPDTTNVDTNQLLLIKADDGGMVDRIFAPAIYRDEHGNMILKIGNNNFNVTSGSFTVTASNGKPITETGLKCGNLIGEINWAEKTTNRAVTVNGEKLEYAYHDAWVDFVNYANADLTYYRVHLKWETTKEVSKSTVGMLIKTGEPVTEYLELAPRGGGGSTAKLKDLIADGNKLTVNLPYQIPLKAGYKVIDGQYGESYILSTQDGSDIWAQGKIKAQIGTNYEVTNQTYINVSSVRFTSDGKVIINCALRESQPEPVTTTTKPASAKPATITQTAEATTLF